MLQISSDKQQRDRESANADAESIVNQIKKLRAGTSVDDEDRMNTLANLQHLADQLLDMVGASSTLLRSVFTLAFFLLLISLPSLFRFERRRKKNRVFYRFGDRKKNTRVSFNAI